MELSTVARNAAANAVVDLVDGGTGSGYVEIWTAGKALLLATLTFSATAFGAAVNGVATAATITGDSSADNGGTAAEFYVYDGDDTALWDGDVAASGADMNLNNVVIAAGAIVNITAWTYTQPA